MLADILDEGLVELVPGRGQAGRRHHAAQSGDGYVRGPAADVHDHVPQGLPDVDPRAQGGGLGALLRRWLAARRRTVRVNGQRARILGAIGAIETVVDVTDLKCSAGDPAVFDIDPLYARGFVREYR